MPHRLVTVGYVSVVIGGAWALNHASAQRSDAKLRASENVCLQVGNPGRAVDHLDSYGHARRLREQFEPIIDCHRTYFDQEGAPVPLRLSEQRRYVASIDTGTRPRITRDGRVIAPPHHP